MAVDEALLLSAGRAGQGGATLRFYQWDQPTLSLGYFQRHQDRQEHTTSRECPLVRRSTGGGAILHDRELTYSFTLPVDSHLGLDLQRFYRAFHETLVEELAEHGVTAELCVDPPKLKASDEPFLCFQRRADGDVVANGAKICGSAQRRHRGALLQHGSVLLDTSPAAPELPGINNLFRSRLTPPALAKSWVERIARHLDTKTHPKGLEHSEQMDAKRLFHSKFTNSGWCERR